MKFMPKDSEAFEELAKDFFFAGFVIFLLSMAVFPPAVWLQYLHDSWSFIPLIEPGLSIKIAWAVVSYLMAVLAFWFIKTNDLRTYAFAELMISALLFGFSIYKYNLYDADEISDSTFIGGLSMATSIYVAIRGLDNFSKAQKQLFPDEKP